MSWEIGKAAVQWLPALNAAETKFKVPFDLLARQCYQESHFNPAAVNAKTGAVGIMQLLPKYFPGAGKDPVADINTAASYLYTLFRKFRDWQLALAGYDWGPGNLQKWLSAKGTFQTLPKETQDYVSEIISDVPVQGVLCKILKSPSPKAGSPPSQPSAAPPLAPSSGKSLWGSVIGFLKHPLTRASPEQSQASVSSPPVILFQTPNVVNQGEIMSTPDPIPVVPPTLVTPVTNPFQAAAIPTAVAVLQAAKQLLANLGTDPLQVAAKAPGAFAVFVGTVQIQLPGLLGQELGAVQTEISAKLDQLISKLTGK